MRNFDFDFDFDETFFGDVPRNVFNEALRDVDQFDAREPASPSVSELVDLFIEYRKKRAGRRGLAKEVR